MNPTLETATPTKLTTLLHAMRLANARRWLTVLLSRHPLPLDRVIAAFLKVQALADGSERRLLDEALDGATIFTPPGRPEAWISAVAPAAETPQIERWYAVWSKLGATEWWTPADQIVAALGPRYARPDDAFARAELVGADDRPLYVRRTGAEGSHRNYSTEFADLIAEMLSLGLIECQAKPGGVPAFRRTWDPDAAVLFAATREGALWAL